MSGGGSVERYATKNGPRWRASLKATSRTGEKQRASKSFATKREAQAWLAQQVLHAGHGGRLGKGTLGAYLQEWIAKREALGSIRPNTLSSYRGKMRDCAAAIGHVPLSKLAAEDIEAWMVALAKRGLSRSSVVQSRVILHKALGDAVKARRIPFNPCAGVEAPELPMSRKPKVDTLEDAQRYLAALDETLDGPFFRLMAMTGMRRSEIGALAWDAVELDLSRLHVRASLMRESVGGKSNWILGEPKSRTSFRTLSLAPQAVDLLHRRRAECRRERLAAGRGYADLDLVFGDALGFPQNLDAITARARRVRQRLGLPEGVQALHGLRHLYGTTQNTLGTDVKTIQAAMGHSRASTTLDLYIEADRDAQDEAARKAGDLFG